MNRMMGWNEYSIRPFVTTHGEEPYQQHAHAQFLNKDRVCKELLLSEISLPFHDTQNPYSSP